MIAFIYFCYDNSTSFSFISRNLVTIGLEGCCCGGGGGGDSDGSGGGGGVSFGGGGVSFGGGVV